MNNQRLLTVLTLMNLGLLIFLLSQRIGSVEGSGAEVGLRGRALEIVDAQGKFGPRSRSSPKVRREDRMVRSLSMV
jgi:hypothetical protein